MRKVIAFLIISVAIFADNSSIDRPNMYAPRSQEIEILENVDHTLNNIHNELAVLRAIVLETQRSNEILSVLNDNLIALITEQQKATQSFDYMAWHQDHKLAEIKPVKKGS